MHISLFLLVLVSLNYLKYCTSNYSCKPGGFYDYRNNKCVYCKDQGLFLQNGSCVNTCGEYHRNITEINTCYKCSDETLLYYREKCVKSCPKFSIENRTKNYCLECNWNNTYYFEGKCIEECPYYTSIDEDEKICLNCKDSIKYLYNGKCVDKCPHGSTLYNLTNNLCVECKYQGRVTHSVGTCGEYCINNTLGLDEDFKCSNCTLLDKRRYNGFCTESCPIGTYNQTSSNCLTCKSEDPSQFYFQSNSSAKGHCVESCGELGVNYKSNVCIVDATTYFSSFNKKCENNAITQIVNSRYMMCLCKKGYSGIYCDADTNKINSLQNTMSTFFKFINNIVTYSNFNFKKNDYYNQFLKDFNSIVYNNVQLVYNAYTFSISSEFKSIQGFITKYFRSNEINSFEKQDIYFYYKSYDLIFTLNYQLLWANYQNYTGTFDIKKQEDALKLFHMNIDDFLINLISLRKLIFTNSDYYIDRLQGYYAELNSNLTYINSKIFSSNVFNLNIFRRKSLQNIQSYNSFFEIDKNCNTENSYFTYEDISPDFTYFYSGAKMRSSYVHIGFYNSSYNPVKLTCKFSVLFPIIDSPLFNFTIPLKNYYNLTDKGINPFDKNDAYFSDVCYTYAYNNTKINMYRSTRIMYNFLNATISCKYRVIKDLTNSEGSCTFAGFRKYPQERGGGVFLRCDCEEHDNNKYYFVTIENYNFKSLPNTIINQWFCVKFGFDLTYLFSNPGFIFVSIIGIFEVTAIILANIFLEPNFFNDFDSVRIHDLEYFKYICNFDEKKIEDILNSYQNEQKRISVLNKRSSLNFKRKSSIIFVNDQNDNVKKLKKTVEFYFKNSGYADYTLLPFDTLINIDKRTFCQYFLDYNYDYNLLSISFFKFSYFIPKNVRILNFFLYVTSHIFSILVIISPEEDVLDIFGFDYTKVCLIMIYV